MVVESPRSGRLLAKEDFLTLLTQRICCVLLSEFGSVCERKKLRVNVGESKVMRRLMYGNWC